MRSSLRRRVAFLVMTALTSVSLLAVAQPRKTRGRPSTAAPARRHGKPAAPAKHGGHKAGHDQKHDPKNDDPDASAPMATKEDRAPAGSKDAGAAGGGVVESKTLDGGGKVLRFGEVDVEARLKSPQIVYFLRRVRAEFGAGDLGHRTFMRELSETRNDPQF
jgi:hypothetical protein